MRERCLTALDSADEPAVVRLFGIFRAKLDPVGAAKALHALAPTFFSMWDNDIARGYGVSPEDGYFQFMLFGKGQLMGLPTDLIPGLSLVKTLDEYNYYKFSTPREKSSEAKTKRKEVLSMDSEAEATKALKRLDEPEKKVKSLEQRMDNQFDATQDLINRVCKLERGPKVIDAGKF